MKKRAFKIALYFFAGFILFFSFRFLYSKAEHDYYDEEEGFFDMFESSSSLRKNYASDSYKYKSSKEGAVIGQGTGVVSVDQKYEKIASIASKTEKYDDIEKQVRGQLKAFNTVIQFEQKSGNKGNRSLVLMIGVKPESFDSLYAKLKLLATNKKAEITKIDKTNEFKALNARKQSLEKTRNALIALKSQNGKIEEFIALEERILSIEDTLQFLGVSLGDFDLENEFCTIRYSLSESKPKAKMSFLHRAKVSLEWSIQFYLSFVFMLLIVFACSYLLLFITDKFKIIQAILRFKDKDNQSH
ncbi:MAG: DUF4349 domain-containing protein [Bacteroidia bacterium]|nr:DUF4349 domain-containing protein [Bacteroidia bacterium]